MAAIVRLIIDSYPLPVNLQLELTRVFYSDIIHTQFGSRKAQFTPVGLAILAIALVSLGVMALSASEALANDDSRGVCWTKVETQNLLGPSGDVFTRSLHLANLAVGDPIPRIQCQAGYAATLYAQGLSAPDGLAFSPSGVLHVAEETAGRVSRIESGGSITTVVSGLANPEGIAFDTDSNLYVVEDIQNGRLLQVTPSGDTNELATNLDWPEGVVWASGGTTYITESNFEELDPFNLQTRVTAVVSPSVTVLTTDTLSSYAGITLGADGLLYVTNELSGFASGNSVFTVDPVTGTRTLFVAGLRAPEGLRFAANGDFPLYVAEEDTGEGAGRVSRIEADGSHAPFCTGFGEIEDVAVDDSGRLYVSEDSTGFIIVIEYNEYLPINLSVSKTVTPTTDITYHGTVTYTIALSNSGVISSTGVLLTDMLPSQVDFASWVVQPANANETNGQITWSGTVTASEAITFTFVVTHTGDYGDVVTNTVEYSHISGIGSDDATFIVESAILTYLPIILKGVKP